MNLKDPKTQKIIMGAVILGTASYIYFGTTFLPFNYPVRKAKIAQLEAEYQKLSTELEKARKVVNDLARLEAEYERLHEQWESAQELLPEEKEMPELLRKVTEAGVKSGIDFALFEPQAPVAREFYTDHPVKVKVRGNYHQVGFFLSRLANLPRIVNVSNMSLSEPSGKAAAQKGKNRPVANPRTVEAQFTLSAYTLMGGIENEAVEAQHAQNK